MQVTKNILHDASDWKMITLTTLFYFTNINSRDPTTTVTTLLLSIKYFSSQEFQCFHKICMRHSNFNNKKFSGVLHALLPKKSSVDQLQLGK